MAPCARIAALATAAFLASPACAQFGTTTAPRLDQIKYVHEYNADTLLQPGDIMLKRLNDSSPATTVGISISQGLIQSLHGTLGSDDAAAGDNQIVHVAIYLGNGETAEAHGETPGEAAGVSLRRLSKHAGFLWAVYRPADAALAKQAVSIARTWATGRMGYLAPLTVPGSDSSFGPKARDEALMYGHQAASVGGPKGVSKMFCSQFVLAAYQAAWVQRLMKADPRLTADRVTMYPGMDKQPSNTSPLVMHGRLRRTTHEWKFVAFAVTQEAPRLDTAPKLPYAGPTVFKAASGRCIVAVPFPTGKPVPNSAVVMGDCITRWSSKGGTLIESAGGLCLSLDNGRLTAGNRLIMWNCHGGADQRWTYANDQLKLTDANLCASSGSGFKGQPVTLAPCKAGDAPLGWKRTAP